MILIYKIFYFLSDFIIKIKDKKKIIILGKKDEKFLSPFSIKNRKEVYLYFSKDNGQTNFNKNTKIYLAKTHDFYNWNILKKPIIQSFNEKSSQRTLSPSIIKTSKKNLMVFEGRDQSTSSIFLATSLDLVNWQIKKKAVLSGCREISYFSPFIYYNNIIDKFFLYYCKRSNTETNICLNIYQDDSLVTKVSSKKIIKQTLVQESYSVYAPSIIKHKNRWVMFYAAWGGEPITGKIMIAKSKDGIEWHKISKPLISPSIFHDIKHCSEPSFIRHNNENYIFYEGCSLEGSWSIIRKKINSTVL